MSKYSLPTNRQIHQLLLCLLFVAVAFLVFLLHHIYTIILQPWISLAYDRHNIHLSSYPKRPQGGIPYYTFSDDFHPVNERGVYSFRNVCIEDLPGPPIVGRRSLGNQSFSYHETKRVIVYDSFFRSGEQTLTTAASVNAFENKWKVFFSYDAIPASHRFTNDTAYFISQSCPGNFHHFWNDEFVQLFSLVEFTNRLNGDLRNRLIYRTPWDNLPEESSCDNVTVYEYFLKLVNIVDRHDVFWKMDSNICFQNAVFGLVNLNVKSRDVVTSALKRAKVSRRLCANQRRLKLTLVQRENRRILNIQELLEVANNFGFKDNEIVKFEALTVLEQMQKIACTDVLVGVQGAGLQWSVFMPQNSTLIEIAWPEKFWGFYFTSWVRPYGINHKPLIARYVHVNWATYEEKVRRGRRTSSSERQELLKSPPRSTSLDNIWKWADVVIDPKDFSETLRSIMMS